MYPLLIYSSNDKHVVFICLLFLLLACCCCCYCIFFETESLFVALPIVELAVNNWMASNSYICLSESSEC